MLTIFVRFVKREIRADFAKGLQEFDQKLRNSRSGKLAKRDPNTSSKSDVEIGDALPVFCTSCTSYQILCRRMEADDTAAGFQTPAATEIPAVKAHCITLTEEERRIKCDDYLHKFLGVLNSLSLWSLGDDRVKFSKEQREQLYTLMNASLRKL